MRQISDGVPTCHPQIPGVPVKIMNNVSYHYRSFGGSDTLLFDSSTLDHNRWDNIKPSSETAIFRRCVADFLLVSLLGRIPADSTRQQESRADDHVLQDTEILLNYLSGSIKENLISLFALLKNHEGSHLALLENGNVVAVDNYARTGDHVYTLRDQETQVVLHQVAPGSPFALSMVDQQTIATSIHQQVLGLSASASDEQKQREATLFRYHEHWPTYLYDNYADFDVS